MELQELYSVEVMDMLIGIAVDEDRIDLKGFKALLKEYNDGTRNINSVHQKPSVDSHLIEERMLTRDYSYYEDLGKGDVLCRQ